MTTIKSIVSTLLLSVLIIFSSCKKDDDKEPDPRNAFVGEYEMEAQCNSAGGEIELEVEKDTKNAKGLLLNSSFFEYFDVEDVEAEISGSGFEIDPIDVRIVQNGQTYTGKLRGEGILQGKELTIHIQLSGNISDVCELVGDKQ